MAEVCHYWCHKFGLEGFYQIRGHDTVGEGRRRRRNEEKRRGMEIIVRNKILVTSSSCTKRR